MTDARRLQEIATDIASARQAALKLVRLPVLSGRRARRSALIDLNTSLELAASKVSSEITMAFEEAQMMQEIERDMRRRHAADEEG